MGRSPHLINYYSVSEVLEIPNTFTLITVSLPGSPDSVTIKPAGAAVAATAAPPRATKPSVPLQAK